jgi:hypothetical protein
MPTPIDLKKAEIPILPHDSVLAPIHDEGRISRCTELSRMCVVDGQTYSLAAEPVGDVICVAEDRTEESIHVSRHANGDGGLTRSIAQRAPRYREVVRAPRARSARPSRRMLGRRGRRRYSRRCSLG